MNTFQQVISAIYVALAEAAGGLSARQIKSYEMLSPMAPLVALARRCGGALGRFGEEITTVLNTCRWSRNACLQKGDMAAPVAGVCRLKLM
jgi:hypothetical protein